MAVTATIYNFDVELLVSALVARLERRVAFSVSISDRELYVSIGSEQISGTVVRLSRWG